MLLIVLDIISSLVQSIFIAWTCNSIIDKENKIDKFTFIILNVCIFINIEVLTFNNINPPVANFLMALITLSLIIFFYRKSILDVLWGFGLSYGFIIVISYVILTIYKILIINMKLKILVQFQATLFIYIPAFVFYILFYKNRKQIFNRIMILKNFKHSSIIIQIIIFILIFINTFQGEWVTINMPRELSRLLAGMFIIICSSSIIYFYKVNNSSKKVEILNETLSNKILELKKIKNVYLNQMNTIYNFYKLKRYDELGDVIKCVIQKNQNSASTIANTNEQNPIISAVLNQAISKGVNVIALDKADYTYLSIDGNEFLKLLSNIVNNAIDAMAGIPNPIIKFNSYNNINGITITIGNNGPKIPDDVMNNIFNTGFSTKENTSNDRGFGLSIVKDIINKCEGNISVESDNEWTKFKIDIPLSN